MAMNSDQFGSLTGHRASYPALGRVSMLNRRTAAFDTQTHALERPFLYGVVQHAGVSEVAITFQPWAYMPSISARAATRSVSRKANSSRWLPMSSRGGAGQLALRASVSPAAILERRARGGHLDIRIFRPRRPATSAKAFPFGGGRGAWLRRNRRQNCPHRRNASD